MDDLEGRAGEIVERFMQLLDQSPLEDPHWWFNYGALSGAMVSFWGFNSAEDSLPQTALDGLRHRLLDLTNEVDEGFLIRALVRELDDWTVGHADTGKADEQSAGLRAHLMRVRDDLMERERMREKALEDGEDLTDEEVVERIEGMLNQPFLQPTTAEAAADKWALLEKWREQRDLYLSEEIFEQWNRLRLRRR